MKERIKNTKSREETQEFMDKAKKLGNIDGKLTLTISSNKNVTTKCLNRYLYFKR